MPQLINDIKSKLVIPTKIYKSKIGDKFTIEVEENEPISFTSVLYKREADRDTDYKELDEECFWSLPFNPNAIGLMPGIPGPLCNPSPVTPLI